jgi:DNA-binding HxlR family transcriptional regulator
MHDERTPAVDDDRPDAAILDLLLYDEHQHPWADEELARDLGDQLTATDALSRLERTGLVHRHDGFVFPARAARRAAQLMR